MKPNSDTSELAQEHESHHDHQNHHAYMAADFRKRFWIALVLTLPILILSPLLQELVGLREAIRFPGDLYALFGLSTAVFFYGGWPFLKGLFEELKSGQPGMMTLVAVAITTAYGYSSAVVFGLIGKSILLGIGHPGRRYASRALDRDVVGDGCLQGLGRIGETHAFQRSQAYARR